jgi:hypothetical protein
MAASEKSRAGIDIGLSAKEREQIAAGLGRLLEE